MSYAYPSRKAAIPGLQYRLPEGQPGLAGNEKTHSRVWGILWDGLVIAAKITLNTRVIVIMYTDIISVYITAKIHYRAGYLAVNL